jgi:hypothetical protein
MKRRLLQGYVLASMGLGLWVSREADLRPWQAAATVLVSPVLLAAAVVHEARCAVEGWRRA